jgi:hypothetical protein
MFYQLIGEISEASPRPMPEQAAALASAQCNARDAPPIVADDTPTPPNALVIPILAR